MNEREVTTYIAILLVLIGVCFYSIFQVYTDIRIQKIIPPTPRYIGKEISRGNTTKQQVIFTFDGGSESVSTEKILDTLKQHSVRGTFFLTGVFVEKYTSLVQRMITEGHEVFSHTYDHPYLTQLPDAEIIEQFASMENTLQSLVGTTSKPYFRPPYGDRDARVIGVARSQGYQSVFWTLDALDWRETEGETKESVKARILSHVTPGEIYLFHLGDTISGDILDDVFTTLKSQGYTPVSLTQGI